MVHRHYTSIVDRLFSGKTNTKEVVIRGRKAAISLASGMLFIGRTPGRFVDIKGHAATSDLSIKEALDILGANQAATRIFPLSATPGGHWIYFALFSACRQAPGLNCLNRYITVLSHILERRNAGVARRLLGTKRMSKRQLRSAVERYRRVHDIRLRIHDDVERKLVIQKDVLPRLHALIMQNRWSRSTYKSLAREFRSAWCRQSGMLRIHNNEVLVKNKAPRNLRDTDLIRVYAGYWLIRSLYGIELKDGTDEIRREDNAYLIRRAAQHALHYLGMLKKHTSQSYENLFQLLVEARRSGEPPLIHEYYRRQAEGGRVLSGFRLSRFWQILHQLDRAVKEGT